VALQAPRHARRYVSRAVPIFAGLIGLMDCGRARCVGELERSTSMIALPQADARTVTKAILSEMMRALFQVHAVQLSGG
jgi:hypothetical protein